MKIIGIIFTLITALVVLGSGYQWFSEANDSKFIPGELVSFDENVFHLFCMGQGSPVVFVENGLTAAYVDWHSVFEGVSKETRICTYDRLGLGWSSANDKPTTSEQVVVHLNRLIQIAGIDEPLLLVGFSAGGIYAREYYRRYPEKIAGMILVDSAHEQQADRMEFVRRDLSLIKLCNAVSWTGATRLLGVIDGFIDPTLSESRWQEESRLYNRTGFCKGMVYQVEGMESELLSNKTPQVMGETPLTVISAGKTLREQIPEAELPESFFFEHSDVWPKLQKELASLSRNSRYVVAEGSGHAVHIEKPKIVIDEILRMLQKFK
jgi:pimeloyl-ACP methyl ester carboxylesterase